ncbi:MAG: PAS domain S-box protein [Chitinophagaceae bacterium]
MKNSAPQVVSSHEYPFLQGGGEMGALIRAKDWSNTPLGEPGTWPQSLCTMVSVMLDNPFGMYIAWGKEYTQIYNDGYRPILGTTKHPYALGISTRETFKEIWHIIESMFDGVMNGKPVGFPDFMLPLNRNNFVEDCYFDFSYSPIRKENGEVGGVLVTVIETTNKKRAEADLKESKDQLQFAIEAAELGTWDYNPLTNKFIGNNRLKDWFGLQHDAEIELPLALAVMAEKDRSRVEQAIQRALKYESGGLYNIEYSIINALTRQERIVSAKGRAWFGEDKKAYRFNGTLEDITDQAIARKKIEESEHRFRFILEHSLDPILILKGENMVLEIANEPLLKLWSVDKNALGKPFLEILPEMKEQGFFDMLQDVYFNDKIIKGNETPVTFIRPDGTKEIIYFNFTYQPYREENGKITGVLVIASNVTWQVEAKKQVEESEERFRSLANDMAAFVFTGDAETNVDFVNRQWLEFVGLKTEEGLGKAWVTVTHPDDVEHMSGTYEDAVSNQKPYEIEIRQLNTNGEYCWVLWKGIPRITKDGRFAGMIGVGIDITYRKKIEQALYDQQAETEKLQRLYEAVTANTPDLIYILDLDCRFTYANPALLAMWGKSWDEAIGKNLLENGYEPWHAAMHEREICEIVLTKKSIRGTVSFPHAELGKRIYDYIFAPVLNSEGNVEAIAGTTRDITDITTAEEDLLKSEQQMRAMVETAPFPIGVYIGREMIIQFANQSILNAWGKGNDVIGKSFKQILPELDNQDVFKQLDDVYTTGVPYHTKNQKIDLVIDGETKCFYFNYSFTPLTDSTGKVYGVMNTAADVTDLNLAKLAIQKSEENLRSTILQAPVAMCFFKGENFIVDLSNEKMFELWGKTANDVMHKPIFEGLPEAKDQGFEAILQGVYTTGTTFSADGVPITLPRNGGIELVYVNFVYEPYREANGIISGILAVAIDVTTQLTARKKIEEREQKFRLLADSMPQHIWTADTNGNLNYYNQSVYDYSGLTPQQIDTDGWIQIVHPDDREENIKAWIHSVNAGTDFHFEHRFRRYDGEYRWQLSRAVPQRDEEGNIQMWVGTSTDIQEIKQMDQQKDDFISIASHEMKTPLTTAKGYLELLQMQLSEENQTILLYASKANQALERLNGLVTELLDASKIQNGQLNYNISTFDFNAMLDETIENIQHTTKIHTIQKTGTAFHPVTGDKNRLQQVLINLLSNAIKYSPNADKVFIKVEEQPGKIQVSVQDFGIGLSGQHLDKIFNRYYRVQEHAIYFQGLGIGLYLSSNIIQRHDGTMWADSEPGKGSTFYFTIPIYSEQ